MASRPSGRRARPQGFHMKAPAQQGYREAIPRRETGLAGLPAAD